MSLFALERYDSSGLGAEPEPLPPLARAGTRLVATVFLPGDDVLLALVESPDADTVAGAAAAAGWTVDRLLPARWISVPGLAAGGVLP